MNIEFQLTELSMGILSTAGLIWVIISNPQAYRFAGVNAPETRTRNKEEKTRTFSKRVAKKKIDPKQWVLQKISFKII